MIDGLVVAAAIGAMRTTGVPEWIPQSALRQVVQGALRENLVVSRHQPSLQVDLLAKAEYLKPTAISKSRTSLLPFGFSGSVVASSIVNPSTMTILPELSMIASKGESTVKMFDYESSLRTNHDIRSQQSDRSFFEQTFQPNSLNSILQNSQAAQPFVEAVLVGESKNVSLALSSTPLETVVSLLSKQVGINIVLLAKPDQKVTINVKDMNLMEAMKHLAALSGLKVLKVRNTLVMADESTLKGAYPKDFEREYAGTNAETSSSNSTAPSGPTNPDAPTKPSVARDVNRVVTTNFQSAVQLALSLKDFLQAKGVMIVALPNTLVPSIDATSTAQNGGASTGLNADRGQSETGSRKVLLSGPLKEVEAAIQLIEELDVARRQVEITVTIHDVSNDALKEEGFNWNFGQFTVSENTNNSINFGKFTRTGTSFQATMRALEQNDRAKLLASPNVSVMDGLRAFILIGEKRQFPVVNGTTPTGQFIFSTQEQNIGIYLQVAADVAKDGTITLAVKPQVSAIIGFLQLNGGSYPQVSTRESQSTLTLKDGQTMLLGGLLRDEEIKNLEQVPLLSRLPLFGELFKYRRTQKKSSQLIISITPKIVN